MNSIDKCLNTLQDMQRLMSDILAGNSNAAPVQTEIPELQTLVTQMNQLVQNLNEINRLALDLSNGKINGRMPSRHNYMAAPMKQLHSELSTITYGLKQLKDGNITSKLESKGDLAEAYNALIEQIALVSAKDDDEPDTKWRCQRLLKTLDRLRVMILEVNDNYELVYANQTAKEHFGGISSLAGNSDNELLESIVQNIQKGQKVKNFPLTREVYDRVTDTWYRLTTDRFTLPGGQSFYFNTIENVSEWKLKESKQKLSAMIDEMTGAYNQNAGLAELENILLRSDPDTTYSITFIDIDDIQAINDYYGQADGDYAIKTVAKVLMSSVRNSDIVSRFGGDEFLIIFSDCNERSAESVIRRMNEKLRKISKLRDKPFPISFSHGIVEFSNHGSAKLHATELLHLASQKMYEHKKLKKRMNPNLIPPASMNSNQQNPAK